MFFFDPSEFTARLQTLLPNARSIRPEDRRTQARRPQRMSYAPCKAHFRTAAQPRGAACRKDALILAADQFSDAFFFSKPLHAKHVQECFIEDIYHEGITSPEFRNTEMRGASRIEAHSPVAWQCRAGLFAKRTFA